MGAPWNSLARLKGDLAMLRGLLGGPWGLLGARARPPRGALVTFWASLSFFGCPFGTFGGKKLRKTGAPQMSFRYSILNFKLLLQTFVNVCDF